MGCYEPLDADDPGFPHDATADLSIVSIQSCVARCKEEGFTFAGLQVSLDILTLKGLVTTIDAL